MAKYAGLVGYVTQEEIAPGVWEAEPKHRLMKGDVLRQSNSYSGGQKVNEDVTLQHRISLVGDPFAFDNYSNIKYLVLNGVKWKVTGVEITRPRLIVTLGGLWNG